MKPAPWLRFFATTALLAVTPLVMSTTAPAAESDSTTTLAANAAAIAYEGRTAEAPGGGVRLAFPGVRAHLHFRGAGVTLKADASNDEVYFDVSLDGAAPTLLRLKKGVGSYALAGGAAAAEHTLVLTRRTESWEGVCTLESFTVAPGGAWLAAPVLPARKVMFIGDSVTCGEFAAWVPGDAVENSALLTNAVQSYGMVLARRLGAQCALVSYGGRGIIRDWQGIRDTNNAPQFYELALPDDPGAFWDPQRYVPDAVGIQLGTNDFNQGIPDENEFVNAYVEFIRVVRRDAPKAWIVVMDSPIVNNDAKGPRRTVLHAYLEEIVRRVRSDRVVLASLKHYPGVPNNGHPTGPEHEEIASELEPVFRRLLGW